MVRQSDQPQEQIENPFAARQTVAVVNTPDVEGGLAFITVFIKLAGWEPGRKFTDTDVLNDLEGTDAPGALLQAATCFALGYVGTFDYLVSMKSAIGRYGKLTPAQTRGTLNCMLAEISRRGRDEAAKALTRPETMEAPQAPQAPAVTLVPLPSGYFTVVFPDGDRVTLRIRKPQEVYADQDPSTRLIAYLAGPDNTGDYQIFGRVVGTKVQVFSRYFGNERLRTAVRILAGASEGDRREAGAAYAMAAGRCCRCGRMLTVPASINAGIGPECAGKSW